MDSRGHPLKDRKPKPRRILPAFLWLSAITFVIGLYFAATACGDSGDSCFVGIIVAPLWAISIGSLVIGFLTSKEKE